MLLCIRRADVTVMETLGHIIGIVAVGVFFLSYQIFDKKKLLLVQTLATALMGLQYILIGAYSGFGLNVVCMIRNVLYYHRDKKILSGLWLPIVLAAVMAGVSLFSWDGYHSLFIILGMMINTVCMGVCNSQNLRKSILITCPLVFVYNLVEKSYGGLVSETLSFISGVIGIIRYKKAHQSKAEKTDG